MPNSKADPIGEVAAAVVADDPVIRTRMTKLVHSIIDDAEYTMRWGTPADRAALGRNVMPALLRSMQGAEVNASEAEAAAAYRRMMSQLRGDAPDLPEPVGGGGAADRPGTEEPAAPSGMPTKKATSSTRKSTRTTPRPRKATGT